MSDTIQLDSLDDFEEDTLVDLHLSFTVGNEGDVTRVVEFAELARMLDAKSSL